MVRLMFHLKAWKSLFILILLIVLPFFSAKAMASSLEEKLSIMLDKGSALKDRKKSQ